MTDQATLSANTDMVRFFLRTHPNPEFKDMLCYDPGAEKDSPYTLEDWSDFVNGRPEDFIEAFREAGQPTIRGYPVTELKDLSAGEHVNKLLAVRGKVIAVSDNEPYPYELCYQCDLCEEIYYVKGGRKPRCDCSKPKLKLLLEDSRLADSQIIKLQELESSSVPARLTLRVVGKSQIWKAKPGQKIEALGFMKLDTITEKRTNKVAFLKRFETYCLSPLLQEDEEFKPTKEDIERFQNDVNAPFFWEMLTGSIAPHIAGFTEIKETLAILLASVDTEFPLNCFLVGDPSVAKSLFLLYAARLSANGHYNSFAGAKWPSLSAHAQQDSETGSWIVQPGLLALADGGMACLDEMHTIEEGIAGNLNEAGEQKTISYAKGGQVGTLSARCAWFFASNSYFGDWRSDLDISENLKFLGKAREALISRFPLIFILTDVVNEENDRKIARQVIENNTNRAIKKYYEDWTDANGELHYGFKTLKKFFIWIQSVPLPEIPDDLNDKIENWYVAQRKNAGDKYSRLIKARFLDKAIKITKMKARILAKGICDNSDFEYAEKLLKKSMDAAAFVPATGELDPNIPNGSRPAAEIKKEEDRESQFWNAISKLSEEKGYATTKELIAELSSWKEHEVTKMINAQSRAGKLLQTFGQERWTKA